MKLCSLNNHSNIFIFNYLHYMFYSCQFVNLKKTSPHSPRPSPTLDSLIAAWTKKEIDTSSKKCLENKLPGLALSASSNNTERPFH